MMAHTWATALFLAAAVVMTLMQGTVSIALSSKVSISHPMCYHQGVVVNANSRFAIDLYKNIACSVGDDNMIFSPFSVSAALAMTYGGASGVTATQMARALRFNNMPSYCSVHQGFLALMNLLQNTNNQYILSTANRIFVDLGFNLNQNFQTLTQTYYLSPAWLLDIRHNTANSLEYINDWVASETNNKITNLLPSLDPATSLVLVNAITFKGEWVKRFDVTYTGTFHKTCCETIQTTKMRMACGNPMMKHGNIPAFDAQILELPYKGNKVSMYVLRPNHIEGLAYLENSLDLGVLNTAIAAMSIKDIDLKMPKFSLTQTFDLKPILKALGMFDVFSRTDADLQKIAASNVNLYVDFVVHQAIIDVNENGTEASAATAVGVCRAKRHGHPPVPFDIDRPFLFFIREQTSGSILFMGRLINPAAAAATGITGDVDFKKFIGKDVKTDRVYKKV